MGNITSLSAFTTKLKSLMKTTFLHKRASSPDFASAKVPVTYEDNGNKTYYDSTVTGADLQKLYGASSDLPANQTITGAISTLSSQPVLLWTNPNPNDSFEAQTISLDLSSYRFIMCIMGGNQRLSFIQKVGDTTWANGITTTSSSYLTCFLRIFSSNANGVTFGVGIYQRANNPSESIGNEYLAPIYIYGIK